ncbi:MAG: class I SAM-dependent methyltransferase [Chloroflexota bacterium]
MSWTESDSQNFIDYGRYFVPERDLQIKTFCDLVSADAKQILELCCGAGLLAGALLERCPQATVHAYDGSVEMLNHTQQQLAAYGDRLQTKQFDIIDTSWRSFDQPLDAVVSSLAIHHLDGPQKQQLFADVYRMLAPGGVFVVADVMLPSSEAGTAVAADMWDEATREQAVKIDGNLDGFAYFEREKWNMYRHPEPPEESIDKPSTLFDQLAWLAQVGFSQVDVYWMKAGHALFGGVRR